MKGKLKTSLDLSALPEEEKKPVKLCGYHQNCFLVDSVNLVRERKPLAEQKSYISMEKKILPNGYIEFLVKKQYPITSESVSSLAEGADYRNDPNQAIAGAVKRVNLGDVTEVQTFLNNPMQSAALYGDVKAKLSAYYSSILKQQEDKENKEVSGGESDNG